MEHWATEVTVEVGRAPGTPEAGDWAAAGEAWAGAIVGFPEGAPVPAGAGVLP